MHNKIRIHNKIVDKMPKNIKISLFDSKLGVFYKGFVEDGEEVEEEGEDEGKDELETVFIFAFELTT